MEMIPRSDLKRYIEMKGLARVVAKASMASMMQRLRKARLVNNTGPRGRISVPWI
jgi:hypothetical protein